MFIFIFALILAYCMLVLIFDRMLRVCGFCNVFATDDFFVRVTPFTS